MVFAPLIGFGEYYTVRIPNTEVIILPSNIAFLWLFPIAPHTADCQFNLGM